MNEEKNLVANETLEKSITISELYQYFGRILKPERDFYVMAIIYGLGISLLSLATPISVQMLINTVANTGLTTPLIVLSVTLFILLLIAGLLNALRLHLMEIFGRRFYARMVSEITLRSLYAQNPFFNDDGRRALFNRYFDIITVQKMVPTLLIGGFTLLLQAGVGFVLVALYHPYFLIFNLLIVAIIWIIWLVWGRTAVRSAIALSHKKHAMAAWLEGLGASNGFFKSQRHIAYALEGTDTRTQAYVEQHKKHFRAHFAQTISFLVLYAAASAILLGLGGWLVIGNQLSIGQLVAAELVLSAAFFGVSQLGTYMNYFYDLCAAIEEISLFYDVTQEEPSGKEKTELRETQLTFLNVQGDARGRKATLNFTIPSGSKIMASAANHGVQRLTTNLLKRHIDPKGGYIAYCGGDLIDRDVHTVRQEIILLDRPTIIESTIREYLNLNVHNPAPETILTTLRMVGLEPVITQLERGLDTSLATTGWPLSIAETMQLKLAAALIARPRVLIMSQLFDLISEPCLSEALQALQADKDITLVYFSNRNNALDFKHFLYLDYEHQHLVNNFDQFKKITSSRVPDNAKEYEQEQKSENDEGVM